MKINANKLNCIYHQPGAKSLCEPKLDSDGKVFSYIELGSNFVSLSAAEQIILSRGHTEGGHNHRLQQEASANPSIECQQNGVTRGQQNISKNKSQLMSDKINTLNICENCNSEPCICANKSKLMCKICNVYITSCACPHICTICSTITKFNKNCKCDVKQILSLKAKLETKFGLTQYDIISEENQENLSTQIDEHFDRFSLLPPDPGTEVDMKHCNKEITQRMEN